MTQRPQPLSVVARNPDALISDALISDALIPDALIPAQARSAAPVVLPGSAGEHRLQEERGSTHRARTFYDRQMLDHLNERMREFVARQSMLFVATADGAGACDCSFRAGPPGFVHVLDERTLVYPEYRGNGVLASLGNLSENPHVGLIFIDFFQDVIGLHVNGRATVLEPEELRGRDLPLSLREASEQTGGRRAECWVQVEVEEAYIHCSKHIPVLEAKDKRIHWGTDDARRKGGDFFAARDAARPWVAAPGDGQAGGGQTGDLVIDLRDDPAT